MFNHGIFMHRSCRSILILIAVIALCAPETLPAQGRGETTVLQWVVRDTSISKSFLRDYLRTRLLLHSDIDSGKVNIERLRPDDILTVEFSVPNLQLSEVKAISPDGVITKLDKRTIERMDTSVVRTLSSRQYRWDELRGKTYENILTEVLKSMGVRSTTSAQNEFWWPPFSTVISLPTEIFTRLSGEFAAYVSAGNEDFGYLWGTAGTVRAGLATRFVRFYATIPAQGITKRELTGAPGLGFNIDADNYGGGFVFERTDPESPLEKSLQVGAFAYYSQLEDISRTLGKGMLRWKAGPALMVHKVGTDTQTVSLPYERKTSETMLMLYLRIETVGGEIKGYPLSRWATSLQAFLGTKKMLLATGTYNFNQTFGIDLRIATVLPRDPWHSDFTIMAGPRIRF